MQILPIARRESHLPISLLNNTVIPSSSLYSEDACVFLLVRFTRDKELDLDLVCFGVEIPDAPSLKELLRLPILLLALR